MKIADGLKIIENGWIRKPKGFRVKFQKQVETGIEDGYSPPAEVAPLNSDVTAWRYAWKLWQATRTAAENGAPGALYNITVVDDESHPFRFYGTGEFETYNPKRISGDEVPAMEADDEK
ncbi:MAG: hypothetical protein HGJ94_05270 [Desulfosarcina sp.]|nr:hypothetical protein [Desulfosarcina sp.]MBC2742641.1 hypothetical protein [Desulfosarcina sp.]MBC2765551.1 hypothetical protein [Desulfosarcina sp.]